MNTLDIFITSYVGFRNIFITKRGSKSNIK